MAEMTPHPNFNGTKLHNLVKPKSSEISHTNTPQGSRTSIGKLSALTAALKSVLEAGGKDSVELPSAVEKFENLQAWDKCLEPRGHRSEMELICISAKTYRANSIRPKIPFPRTHRR